MVTSNYGPGTNEGDVPANNKWGMEAGDTVGLSQGDPNLALGTNGSAVRCRRRQQKTEQVTRNQLNSSKMCVGILPRNKKENLKRKVKRHPNGPCSVKCKENKHLSLS